MKHNECKCNPIPCLEWHIIKTTCARAVGSSCLAASEADCECEIVCVHRPRLENAIEHFTSSLDATFAAFNYIAELSRRSYVRLTSNQTTAPASVSKKKEKTDTMSLRYAKKGKEDSPAVRDFYFSNKWSLSSISIIYLDPNIAFFASCAQLPVGDSVSVRSKSLLRFFSRQLFALSPMVLQSEEDFRGIAALD